MNKLIYIAIEVKTRELRARCLLAAYFVSRGYKVIIGSKTLVREIAGTRTSGVLIDKDYAEARKYEWKKIKDNGGRVYAIDEEGLTEISNNMFMLRVGYESIGIADGILLWGDFQKQHVEQRKQSEGKLYLTSNPRIDLLGKNIEFFYKKEIVRYIRKYGKYLLFNISFCKDDGKVSLYQTIREASDGTIAEDMKSVLDKLEGAYGSLYDIYCNIIKKLSNIVDNTIIVRPHPGDKAFKEWVKEFAPYKNVKVIQAGDANAWICGSELMIHAGCTTSLEAYLCHKPSILYNPIEKIEMPLLSELSYKATSESELFDVIKTCLKGNIPQNTFFDQKKDNIIKKYIYIDEKATSCERIVRAIEQKEFSEDAFKVERIYDIKDFYNGIKSFCESLKNRKSQSKFGYTSSKEVRKNLRDACNMINYNKRIKVKKINHNVFLLSGKQV